LDKKRGAKAGLQTSFARHDGDLVLYHTHANLERLLVGCWKSYTGKAGGEY
jgi:hypothetical protein